MKNLINSIKCIFFALTGGRPMTFIQQGFRDIVDGRMVNYFCDANGRYWMANTRWSIFRVKLSDKTKAQIIRLKDKSDKSL